MTWTRLTGGLLRRLRRVTYPLRFRQVDGWSDTRLAGPVRVEGAGRVVLGSGVAFGGANGVNHINVGAGATVRIGDRAYLNGVTIDATTDVDIGADCVIGQAWITTTNFHRADPSTRNEPAAARPVVLHDNVWLANRATILPGTTIGANSVVSVGTVVGEDVPADVVVSSHGLRVVKKLD